MAEPMCQCKHMATFRAAVVRGSNCCNDNITNITYTSYVFLSTIKNSATKTNKKKKIISKYKPSYYYFFVVIHPHLNKKTPRISLIRSIDTFVYIITPIYRSSTQMLALPSSSSNKDLHKKKRKSNLLRHTHFLVVHGHIVALVRTMVD